MAYNFSSEQFDKESQPKRMGFCSVPKWAPNKARPQEYRPSPKPICDINGHFLPGAPRGTSKCFGHFLSTWDMPKKITKKVAAELNQEPPPGRFTDWVNLRQYRPKPLPPRLRRAKAKREQAIADAKKAEQNFTRLRCPIHFDRKKRKMKPISVLE